MTTKPGRNDPCPCGSGRKFKFCHGAIGASVSAPAAPGLGSVQSAARGAAPSLAAAPALAAAPERSCGPCTACCEGWAEGEIRGHRMRPGQPCHFLTPAEERRPAESPCRIYADRPESPCRRFVCGWRAAGSRFPDHFRPDLVGVILVSTRWGERPAWILLPAGGDAPPQMLAWMQVHAQRTGQPFYYTEAGERLGYGPQAFQQDMLQRLQRGEKLW